ncbi:hypothetical protein OQA88_9021 [Cercophora sp. LCS_1]
MRSHILTLILASSSPVLARCGSSNAFNPPPSTIPPLRLPYPIPPPVNLTVHIVAASKARADGYLTPSEVATQIAIIKNLYAPTGITFLHTPSHNRWTINPLWAGPQVGQFFNEMKSTLHIGDYRTLNLYFRNITAEDYGGICTNPVSEATNQPDPAKRLLLDGCVIASFTLNGSSHPFMNQGKTAVHEMGHWFGLFHPFHDNGLRENNTNPNACSPTNPDDHVLDTPKMRWTEGMSGGCDKGLDSCPGVEGRDPVENYMSWSSDECMTTFTRGQAERMYEVWDRYRGAAV